MQPELITFDSDPRRDAYGVIAGFVFQVNTTIMRWLELKEGEVLELERGEDIDLVQSDMRERVAERVLEQTKRRTKGLLTLKSVEAREAVANFCTHREQNPGLSLRFRYVTNAQAGVEKGWPDELGGIVTWEAIRRGQLVGEARAQAVSKVGAFLAGCEWPVGIRVGERELAEAFRDDVLVGRLIEGFEWSAGVNDFPAIADEIKELLYERKYRDSAAGTQQLFERLFVYVFERLAQEGLKRLTRTELMEEVAQRTLPDRDRELFRFIQAVENLESRVSQIETAELSAIKAAISGLEERQKSIVSELARSQGIGVSIRSDDVAAVFDKPELACPLVRRDSTVAGIKESLSTKTMLTIVGEPGSGKTQLCLLAGASLGREAVWIGLPRGQREEQVGLTLDRAAEVLSGKGKRLVGLKELYTSAAEGLKRKLVVIDDLPEMVPGGVVARRLELFVKSGADNAVTFLGTSYYRLPTLAASIGEAAAPRLAREEVEELLTAYACPLGLVKGFANMVEGMTRGLPLLAVAAARYCQDQGWMVTEENFAAMFGGEFAKGIKRDAKKMVELTVSDVAGRELLYRLTLAIGGFSRERVERVAKVDPRISLPGEKIDRLMGLWIQPYGGNRLIQSPLLDVSLGSRLDSRTQAGVYAVLGFDILRGGALGPLEVITCVHHFNMAGLFNQAAFVLIQALSLLTGDDFDQEMEFASFWTRIPLLPETDINLRIYAQALQVVALDMRGDSIEDGLADVMRLINAEGSESWGAVIAAAFLGIRLFSKFPQMANECLLVAIRGLDVAKLPGGEVVPRAAGPALEEMLWMTANAARSDADVESWIETVEQLPQEGIQRIAASELAADNSCILTDGIWLREHSKEGKKDWGRVGSLVSRLERLGETAGLTVLRAAAVRTLIMVRAEMLGDMDGAVQMAESFLEKVHDNESVFLITEVTGRQLWYAERVDQAIEWLQKARSTRVAGHALWRRNALVTLAEAEETRDGSAGAKYVKEAVDLSRAEGMGPQRLVESLEEYALALWNAGDRDGSFGACEEGVGLLLENEEQSQSWVKLFIGVFGVATYLSSMASHGRPPDFPNYQAPKQGCFLGMQFEAKGFVAAQKAFIRMKTTLFAEAVGKIDKVSSWLTEAFRVADEIPGARTIYSLGWMGIAPKIVRTEYGEAVRMALISVNARSPGSAALREAGFAEPEEIEALMNNSARGIGSLMMLAVGLAFRLALLQVKGAKADEIAAAVDATRNGGSGDSRIADITNALEESFLQGLDWRELRSRGRAAVPDNTGVGLIYYVGSALKRPLEKGLYMQAWLAREMAKFGHVFQSGQTEIIWPFFGAFWLDAVAKESEQFRTSEAYTRGQVEAFIGDSSAAGVKGLLKAMYFCLGVPIGADIREWLEQE